jgi:antirestriction protein ArdC
MRKSDNQTTKTNSHKIHEGVSFKKQADNTAPNIFEKITDKIISVIEAGEAKGGITWSMQGETYGMPLNLLTGQPYSGVNVLLLWSEADDKKYTSNYWLTFKQAKEMGGHVRKGETAVPCIKWGSTEKEEVNVDGQSETKRSAFHKSFFLFNLEQIEGIEVPESKTKKQTWEIHESAECLIKATGAQINEGGEKAFYRPSTDEIQMPDRSRFENAENFYSVNFHELGHWTAAKGRCDRNLQSRFGEDAYAMEELIAELSAAFISASIGLSGKIENHACYIKSWLKVLKNDKRAIITAASKASQAANFILNPTTTELRKAA